MVSSAAPFDLTDRVAVVIGGSKGIGLGIARALAHLGAPVVIGARDPRVLETVCADIVAEGGRAVGFSVDASDAAGAKRLLDHAVAELGRVDVLVNTLGGSEGPGFRALPILELEDDEFDHCLSFNLKSQVVASRLAARHMIDQGTGGSIINVASATGRHYIVPQDHGLYGSAKAALIYMSAQMALEWAPQVRVNVLVPGSFVTQANTARIPDDKRAKLLARVALHRSGDPMEIGWAAAFLASDAASYITGASLAVDGGMGLVPYWGCHQ